MTDQALRQLKQHSNLEFLGSGLQRTALPFADGMGGYNQEVIQKQSEEA